MNAKAYPIKGSFDIVCDDIAADKSISHRCAIFALLSSEESNIKNFLLGEDTLNSLRIAEQLGATIHRDGSNIRIIPPTEITEPSDILDCGNAGTGMRLYCGLLSSLDGNFVLTGDKYLRGRPMNRIIKPLRSIGAKIDGRNGGNLAPLCIHGGSLNPFRYESPIDSAQVKSAMILASLRSSAKSYYKESLLSRDHTERMLRGMGVDIQSNEDGWIEIMPSNNNLKALDITVPADPSSGFFFAVAAAIIPNSKITITNVSLNPTRIEAYKMLENMGANIAYNLKENIYEPIGDIIVSYNGRLKPITVSQNIAWLIDELPALAIAMTTADGISSVHNAKELRVKESDRISSLLDGLNAAGIETNERSDGYDIIGGNLQNTTIDSHGDHRIAMSFLIAGLISGMEVIDVECIDTSFPNFYNIYEKISKVESWR